MQGAGGGTWEVGQGIKCQLHPRSHDGTANQVSLMVMALTEKGLGVLPEEPD